MKKYSIAELVRYTGGKLIQTGQELFVSSIVTDSRSNEIHQHAVFFAIKGRQHNAHDYLDSLYSAGIGTFVLCDEKYKVKIPEGNIILVDNTLSALQLFATNHRNSFSCPVIGITGSNGKTIVKEWLFQLLRNDFQIVRSPKSYNSQIGVPLSVLEMNENHDLAIFEAGISERDEMVNLEKILHPEIGILTNVGYAHSENFTTREEHILEKLKLFVHSEYLIYSADDVLTDHLISENLPQVSKLRWSLNQKTAYIVDGIEKKIDGSSVKISFYKDQFLYTIPFQDDASIENSIHCFVLLHHLKYSKEKIGAALSALTPIAMRMELLTGENNCILINDSYNSDIQSLAIAIDYMHQQKSAGKNTVILSDILQDRKNDKELYSAVANLLTQKKIDRFIGIGKKISSCAELFPSGSKFFPDTESFLQHTSNTDFHKETILIKGARQYGFERITERLQHKAHETVLEINLNALSSNLAWYRSQLKPGTKIMAMVKAYSYGSGSAEIAAALEYNRADYLAVAYADEGVELRKAGISLPIMVMNPTQKSFSTLVAYGLEPEVYSKTILHELIAFSENKKSKINIHLKFDTGMHRLGFEAYEIEELVELLGKSTSLHVVSIFSHLVASDSSDHDEFSRQQIENINSIHSSFSSHLGYKPLLHILNSAGSVRFPEAQFDMIRLGIGLYGISTTAEDKKFLEPVNTFKTIITQIRSVKKGESIGYNRSGIASKDTRIATLPVGYADGYLRILGNGNAEVSILGKKAKTIGNICMDMCMIDIGSVPEAKEGDEVILFGKEIPVEDLAQRMHTIPYEVLTSISGRVKRIYVKE